MRLPFYILLSGSRVISTSPPPLTSLRPPTSCHDLDKTAHVRFQVLHFTLTRKETQGPGSPPPLTPQLPANWSLGKA